MTESSREANLIRVARFAIAIAACALMLDSRGLAAAQGVAASPIGTWVTQGGGANVKIADCGGKLCGSIVWLKEPLNRKGQPKVDSENPDKSLRSRPLLGLPLLTDFVHSEDGSNVWQDGLIYNPDDGRTYKCTLTLMDDNTLRVHGYVGISLLGKSQTWTRAAAQAPAGVK